jgi:mono/diheme cytochrome c family protein
MKIKHMIQFKTPAVFRIIIAVLISFSSLQSFAQEISDDPAAITAGESLWNANCRTCHRVHQKLIGPAMANVWDRAPSMEWIYAFIRNSQKVIASGDEYAVNLYNEYNKTQMTAFTSLSDEQIGNILAYVKAETIKGPEVAATASAGAGDSAQGSAIPTEYLNAILIGMVVILLLILVILGLIVSVLKKYLEQKADLDETEKEVIHSPISLATITRSPGFIFLVIFLVSAIGFKAVINGLYSIGVQQGYAPKQPIAFSHKIHAGDYEIACQYCHTGVEIGKSANIPSANICMNCHTAVKTESPEIQKIWAAVETNKPIEWVRVHNLPDLSYFNHAQHVNVGGVECQTCHGPIEEMEVVRQHSLLTMGWCIDCHRQTDVNTRGNAYYDKLEELHKSSSKQAMKVEDIGGLECAKCHY